MSTLRYDPSQRPGPIGLWKRPVPGARMRLPA